MQLSLLMTHSDMSMVDELPSDQKSLDMDLLNAKTGLLNLDNPHYKDSSQQIIYKLLTNWQVDVINQPVN